MRRKTLCLDFDGVLHSYSSGWKGATVIPDPPVPGAMAFLVEAAKVFDVCVLSSRSHEEGGQRAMLKAIHRWLHEADLPGCEFGGKIVFAPTGENPPSAITFPLHKPPAFVTIDDRAITFTGAWPSIEEIAAFKPWNMR